MYYKIISRQANSFGIQSTRHTVKSAHRQ